MASNQTSNYGLNQWEATDQVLRTEFNADNSKIDAALKALADKEAELEGTLAGQAATITAKGNCKIVYGTYIGTGTFKENGKNTLTFSAQPIFVSIRSSLAPGGGGQCVPFLMMRDAPHAVPSDEAYNSYSTVLWNDKSVSWYSNSGVADQLNVSGQKYFYVALLNQEQ